MVSLDFLKALLELARDVVAAEQTAKPVIKEELGKSALTELFEEGRNDPTLIIVERVVKYVDEIVRYIRYDGWQDAFAGEREIKQALRKSLLKYRLHQDLELFDRAYTYIREYY